MRNVFFLVALTAIGCSTAPRERPAPEQRAAGAASDAQPSNASVDARPDRAHGDPREVEFGKLAAGYADVFSNSGAVFTPDRTHVVFGSNRDGLPQIYLGEVANPKASPLRLVATRERAVPSLVTKHGDVLFRADTGADENWSIHRVGLDGTGAVELTPGEKLNRDTPFVVDGQPDTMYFTARKMSESRSTLYAASIQSPRPAKAIYTDELPCFLSDVDEGATRALCLQYPQRMENHLLVVDLASGDARKLWPKDARVSIFDAAFSADGEQIYVATDNGTEENVVLALDAKTGEQRAHYGATPSTAMVGGITVAKHGNLIGLSITAGDHAEIVFVDSKLDPTKARVQMPLGAGGLGEFSEDGERVTAAWSTPDRPGDVYSIDPTSGRVEPLRDETRVSLAKMPEIATSIVEIPAFDGGKIPTIVYLRKGEEDRPHPTIVSYHGGPSGVSMVRWNIGAAFWLTLGYAYVEPNVRGSSGFGRAYEAADNGRKRLDAFKDIEASARWASEQPWADKSRMVVYGGSYGGYTTLIALSRWPDLWRAGVNLFGVVDLQTFMATTSGMIRQIFLDEFGDPEKDAAFLKEISPITDVAKIVDPMFTYAGANDPRVPRTESDLIVKALRSRQVSTEYMVADNEGHSLARKETQVEFYARCARFLETCLK
jgi:dipeptidyl aminopeptidase/acylaminoacyl peptidase